jgi:hypothetical protein
MKENNPMNMINREMVEYESTLETIKLLLATINPEIKNKYLDSLMKVISWSGATNDKADYSFMYSLLIEVESNIQKYFHQKDLAEMEVRRKNI